MYVSNITILLFSGYEVIGVEHLPEGPGVIVYYHGAAVLDYAFLVARLYAQSKRCLYSVIERGFYLAPGKYILDYSNDSYLEGT